MSTEDLYKFGETCDTNAAAMFGCFAGVGFSVHPGEDGEDYEEDTILEAVATYMALTNVEREAFVDHVGGTRPAPGSIIRK